MLQVENETLSRSLFVICDTYLDWFHKQFGCTTSNTFTAIFQVLFGRIDAKLGPNTMQTLQFQSCCRFHEQFGCTMSDTFAAIFSGSFWSHWYKTRAQHDANRTIHSSNVVANMSRWCATKDSVWFTHCQLYLGFPRPFEISFRLLR